MMNDVYLCAKLAPQPDHQRDRFILSSARARIEEALIARITFNLFCLRLRLSNACPIDRPGHFSVNDQDCSQPSQLGHRLAKISLSDIWELVDTRMNQETLETYYACRGQSAQLGSVSRNHSAPKANVNVTFILCGFQLLFKSGQCCCGRN